MRWLSQANAGLLIVDRQRRIVSLNRKFINLWSLPKHLIAYGDEEQALNFASQHFKEPESFLKSVGEIYDSPNLVIYDTISLKDGRVFERISQPQLVEKEIVGRIWIIRELSEAELLESVSIA